LVIPLVTQALFWTSGLHHFWVKEDAAIFQSGSFWLADISARAPGIGYLIHTFYTLLLTISGTFLLLTVAWKMRRELAAQAALLAAAGLIAFLFLANSIFGILPKTEFNPFIPGIGLSVILIALAVLRFDFLKQSPKPNPASSLTDLRPLERRSLAPVMLFFILAVSIISAGAYNSYHTYEHQFRAQVENQLASIAELKIRELQTWFAERQADAEFLRANPTFSRMIQHYLENPSDLETKNALQAWLDSLVETHDYERVMILDTEGTERLASPRPPQPAAAHLLEDSALAFETGETIFLDFHRNIQENYIYLGQVIPFYKDGNVRQPLAVVVLRIDPRARLYPYLAEWPVESQTAETLLVRREGNEVVYLNPLRFKPDAALNLRIPIEQGNVLAVKAALGQTGISEGLDYRGNTAIGALAKIPATSWLIVARMDEDEVLAPLRERLWQTMVFFGVLVFVSGASLMLYWRQQRLRYYQAEMKSFEALRASEEKFRLAFDTSPDSITITRLRDGIFVSVNQGFEQISGYTRETVIGKTSKEINIWKNPEDQQKVVETLRASAPIHNFEAPFLTRNGEVHGLMSAAIIHLQGEPHILNITRDITELKQAEKALRESEGRFRNTFEQSAVGITHVSLDGQILRANGRFCDIIGYAQDEMKTLVFQDITHPEELDTDLDYVQQVLSGELATCTIEKRIIRKSGEPLWVELTASLVRDEANQPRYFILVIQDIGERKQTQEALLQTNRDLARSQRIGKLGSWDWNIPGNSLTWSDELYNIWEAGKDWPLTLENIAGQIHPEDQQRNLDTVNEFLTSRDAGSYEFRICCPGGAIKYIYQSIQVTRDETGKPTRMFGIMQDITDRKTAEEALQRHTREVDTLRQTAALLTSSLELDQVLESLFDQLAQVVPYNSVTVFLLQGEHLQAVAGRGLPHPEKVIGKQFPATNPLFQEMKETRRPVILADAKNDPRYQGWGQTSYTRGWMGVPLIIGGELVGRITIDSQEIDAYHEKHAELALAFANQAAIAIQNAKLYEQAQREIAERKQAEEEVLRLNAELEFRVEERTRELREAQEKLVRQERLAVLGQLAGGVGHELRNPLAVINNATYFLRAVQPDAQPKVREYIAIIENETRTAEKIISDLLDFSRIKSIEAEAIQPAELARRTLERFPAPAGIQVTLGFPACLPPVYADSRQMVQVLGNLVTNACQAMPDGGQLTIQGKPLTRGGKEWVQLSVEDTGVGILPENLSKIFEPLFTTKAKGIGLGLAVSKKLVEANDGWIEVKSQAGAGTIFTVFLPAKGDEHD
jgi:PAS domain S-box-containing protein